MDDHGLNPSSRTAALSEFTVNSCFKNLPEEVIEASKKCLLDWIGVALAGVESPAVRILTHLVREMGGRKQASILGLGMKTNVLNAALVNGTASHVLDYDDAHSGSRSHPSAPLIPALLAVSEYKALKGSEFIPALVLGSEVSTRVGLALGKSYYELGWHATPIVGRLGAAAGVGRLLRLTSEKMAVAFGIAATNAGGLRRMFGTMGKSLHAGKAAMDGTLAAFLAQEGFTAPTEILDGQSNFLEMFSPHYNPGCIVQGLGKDYQILNNSYKWYAACLLIHPAVDGLISIKERYGLDPNVIERIDLEVSPLCMAVANRTDPKDGLEGKFSISFCAALAVEKGRVRESYFTQELVQDDHLRVLMKKVRAFENEGLDESEANVRIKLSNGIQHAHHVAAPKGDPRNPLAFDEVIEKFEDLTHRVLPERRINQVIRLVQDLENVENLSELTKLCCMPFVRRGKVKDMA